MPLTGKLKIELVTLCKDSYGLTAGLEQLKNSYKKYCVPDK
jgi:hypothetical protein